MNKNFRVTCLCFFVLIVSAVFAIPATAQPVFFKNTWSRPPEHIPNNASIDAPLMGNGRVTMSVGYSANSLRYYLSRNDFWRLRSQADNLSGPRAASQLNINLIGFNDSSFSAEQLLQNGITTCRLGAEKSSGLVSRSWVSATENLVFIELTAVGKEIKLNIGLSAPENSQAVQGRGSSGNMLWLTRAFTDSVDIKTEVAVGLKIMPGGDSVVSLRPGKKVILALCVESNFSQKC